MDNQNLPSPKQKYWHRWVMILFLVYVIVLFFTFGIVEIFAVPRLKLFFAGLHFLYPGEQTELGLAVFTTLLLIQIIFGIILWKKIKTLGFLSKKLLLLSLVFIAIDSLISPVFAVQIIRPVYKLTSAVPSPTPTPTISQPTPMPLPSKASATEGDKTVYTDATRSANWKTYTNQHLNYDFRYQDNEYDVKEDNEAEYSKKYNINIPNDFIKSFNYSPPKLINGIRVESREVYKGYWGKYTTVPFAVWVFENPEKLTINRWFDKFRYYPFRWDSSIPELTEKIRPSNEMTIGGVSALASIAGEGMQYFYILQDNKIFLLHIWEQPQSKNIGNQILSTFQFTQ